MSEKTIAIIGRPNVGKSALFNRLAGRTISIVHNEPGITRDRITAICTLGEIPFTMIDTGGIGSTTADAEFSKQVHLEADIALSSAQILLLVVDGRQGLTPVDQELSILLRKSKKHILLVVNKIDTEKHEDLMSDFSTLGFKHIFPVSAAHGLGIGALVDTIVSLFPQEQNEQVAEQTNPFKITLTGKPNVGKSSLINAILQDKRTIVSDIAGTTRDSVDIPYSRGKHHYTLIDTAGIRHRSRHDTSVEVFSVMRSERSIRRADLCALVLDASAGVTTQDKKIAGIIQKAEKPCLVLINKWDLLKPMRGVREARTEMLETIRRELFFLDYAPILAVSAKNGEHLSRIFQKIDQIRQAASARIGTGVLNRFIQQCILENAPPVRGNRRPKIFYATQTEGGDKEKTGATRIILFVNNATLFATDYLSYLESRLRKYLTPLPGIPVVFELRERAQKT